MEVVAVVAGKARNDDGLLTDQSDDEDDNDDDEDGHKKPAANKSKSAPMSVANMKKKMSALQRTNTLLVHQVKGVTWWSWQQSEHGKRRYIQEG